MPLFVYRCNTCGRTEEKFRPTERRNESFDCHAEIIGELPDIKFYGGHAGGVQIKAICPGKMIFQPMQRTNFYFNTKGKQYKS